MTERIHSSKPIKVTHIGKNYYEIKLGSEKHLFERSEMREFIEMLDNVVTFHTPDLLDYEDIGDNYE